MKTNTNRVVLNLQQNEAQELNQFLIGGNGHGNQKIVEKISKQLSKTIAKNQVIDNLRKSGPEPTKEMVDKALVAAGVKQPKPVPKKVMNAIGQAVNEVIKENAEEREKRIKEKHKKDKRIQEGSKCPGCGGIALPEPDGTLLCEGCGAITEAKHGK